MRFDEFKNKKDYLLWLDTVKDSAFRNKHFKVLMSGLVEQYPNLLIRDYLDVDKTFTVVSDKHFELDVAVGLFKDVEDYLEEGTYEKVSQVGLVHFNDGHSHSGFWVLLK